MGTSSSSSSCRMRPDKRRLGDVAGGGGAREVLLAGERSEVLELPDVHRAPPGAGGRRYHSARVRTDRRDLRGASPLPRSSSLRPRKAIPPLGLSAGSKPRRSAMLLPWRALIFAVERSGRRRGTNRAGAGQSSHRVSRLRVGLRLQISLRATLGGWDAYRPACANHGDPSGRLATGRSVGGCSV